jgi:hypothetical protein
MHFMTIFKKVMGYYFRREVTVNLENYLIKDIPSKKYIIYYTSRDKSNRTFVKLYYLLFLFKNYFYFLY